MVIPILTLILGIIGGAAVDRYLQRRRRKRKALEEIEITLFHIQRHCWKLNADFLVTDPKTHSDPEEIDMATELTEEEAQDIMRRITETTENLQRHVFEATRILRKHPSLPHRSEMLDALYGEDYPTIEERAWHIAETRGNLRDEIKGYAFDEGGEFLEKLNEHRHGGHGSTSMERIYDPSEPPSPPLAEYGLRKYINTARDGLRRIMKRKRDTS